MAVQRNPRSRAEIDIREIMDYLLREIGHFGFPALSSARQLEQAGDLCGITPSRVRGMLQHTTPVSEDDLYSALVASERLRNRQWKELAHSTDSRRQLVLTLLNAARRRMVSEDA
jgi:hypothetical protein